MKDYNGEEIEGSFSAKKLNMLFIKITRMLWKELSVLKSVEMKNGVLLNGQVIHLLSVVEDGFTTFFSW